MPSKDHAKYAASELGKAARERARIKWRAKKLAETGIESPYKSARLIAAINGWRPICQV